jgi:hypothetical protein
MGTSDVEVIHGDDGIITVSGPGWQVDVVTRSTTWVRPPGSRATDVLAVGGAGGAGAGGDGRLGEVNHLSVQPADREDITIGARGEGGLGEVAGGSGVCIVLSRW